MASVRMMLLPAATAGAGWSTGHATSLRFLSYGTSVGKYGTHLKQACKFLGNAGFGDGNGGGGRAATGRAPGRGGRRAEACGLRTPARRAPRRRRRARRRRRG